MSKIFFISTLCLFGLWSCEETDLVDSEPSIYIAKFPGDKKAAVSFTFDDNCASSFTIIAPLFEQNGFRATFFIIPGNIQSLEWPKWKTLSDKGFEIGNHTMSHLNLRELDTAALQEQINASFELIKTNLNQAPLSFAPPGHLTNDLIDAIVDGKHAFNRASPKHFYALQGWVSSTTKKDAIEHIKLSIKNNSWYVVAAHGVGDGWEPIKESILMDAVGYCKKNEDQIVVETFQNISLYNEEKRHSVLSISDGGNYKTIKVESDLPADVYNYPLTLIIKNHQFPSPYEIYNMDTEELVEHQMLSGNRLMIQVYINNTYQIRWIEPPS